MSCSRTNILKYLEFRWEQISWPKIWVIFGLTRRNGIELHGQAGKISKIRLFSKIFGLKSQKMQNFDQYPPRQPEITTFSSSGQTTVEPLTVFRPFLVSKWSKKLQNLALFYFILPSSKWIWSFTTGQLHIHLLEGRMK